MYIKSRVPLAIRIEQEQQHSTIDSKANFIKAQVITPSKCISQTQSPKPFFASQLQFSPLKAQLLLAMKLGKEARILISPGLKE